MEIRTLKAKSILAPGEAFHFTRAVLSRRQPRALHRHKLHELFWLHNGRARHYLEGSREVLEEGDLVILPPRTAHALQGIGEESRLVNLVIAPEIIERLGDRIPEGRLFHAQAPVRLHRDIRQLAALSQRATALEMAPRTALHAEAFLLPLIAELALEESPLPDAAPAWLHEACRAARRPEVFRDGAAGLVRAAGRAHAHVSRTVQKHLGETPSDHVNRIRMEHAARLLAGTGDGLAEIAEAVGIGNLSHFHRLFRARHGMTPRQYRLRHQRRLVQPV